MNFAPQKGILAFEAWNREWLEWERRTKASEARWIKRVLISLAVVLVLIVFIIVCGILLSTLALGETYYVETDGDNGNTGLSWEQSWATVSKVNSTISVGDTVLFGAGEYFDATIRPPAGGDADHWTVYGCSTLTIATKYQATLYGGSLVTGWTAHATVSNTWWSLWSPGPEGCYYGANSYPITLQNGYPLRGNNWIYSTETFQARIDTGEPPEPDPDSLSWAAGQFYTVDDTVWVWCRNNADPNDSSMVVSCQNPVHLNAAGTSPDISHVRIFGLNLQAGKQGTVMFWDQTDNVIIHHCKIGMGCSDAANACCVFSPANEGDKNAYDTTTFGHYNVVRSCDVDAKWTYDTNWVGAGYGHGDGFTIYCQKHFRIDSCDVYGGGTGINFKGKGAGEVNTGCVAAMNHIHDCTRHGISNWVHRDHDSLYGNFIYEMGSLGISITTSSNPWPGYQVVLFNTIYNCSEGHSGWDEGGIDTCGEQSSYKYNIIDSTKYSSMKFEGYGSAQQCEDQWDIDYNLHWNIGYSYPFEFITQCGNMFNDWQTCGHDLNGSITTNPYLVDPANGDFSRTNLPALTDSLPLGGRWFYPQCAGAWQPRNGGGEPPEGDSLRVRNRNTIGGGLIK